MMTMKRPRRSLSLGDKIELLALVDRELKSAGGLRIKDLADRQRVHTDTIRRLLCHVRDTFLQEIVGRKTDQGWVWRYVNADAGVFLTTAQVKCLRGVGF